MTDAPGGYPRRGAPWSRALARKTLALFGWRIEGALPEEPRFVLIVAPHTSNWDFPICVLAMFATGLHLSWLGKHSLFRFPVAGILRWLGGEPIERSSAHGTVATAIERFAERPAWVLGVSPEGTRRRVEEWKTGFLRIAQGADVPIAPVALDYGRRVLVLLPAVWTSDNGEADLRRIRGLFHSGMARDPRRFADLARGISGQMEPGSPPG